MNASLKPCGSAQGSRHISPRILDYSRSETLPSHSLRVLRVLRFHSSFFLQKIHFALFSPLPPVQMVVPSQPRLTAEAAGSLQNLEHARVIVGPERNIGAGRHGRARESREAGAFHELFIAAENHP